MAKIFIAFYNAISQENTFDHAIPCFYEAFIAELLNLGNELLIIHHNKFVGNYDPIPTSIKNEIANFSPDLAILFNNAFFDIASIFEFPIYIYEVDSIINFSNLETLKQKKDRFKYIVSQTSSIELIQKVIGVKKEDIFYMPFFTSIRKEKLPKIMNISFIGTRFCTEDSEGSSVWSKFMQTEPSEASIKLFKEALEIVKKDPFSSQEILEKNIYSFDENIKKYIDNSTLIDVLSGCNRILTLSEISDLGLTIFGTKSWAYENSIDYNIPLSFNFSKIYSLKHNQDIYNSSKIAININHLQAKTGFSWRVCDIMASDACLVSEYKPDFDILFPKLQIPVFHDRYTGRALCKKILKNEHMRQDIVSQCNEIIEKKFRLKHYIKDLEIFFAISLNTKDKKGTSLIKFYNFYRNNHPKILTKTKVKCKLIGALLLLILTQVPGMRNLLPHQKQKYIIKKVYQFFN